MSCWDCLGLFDKFNPLFTLAQSTKRIHLLLRICPQFVSITILASRLGIPPCRGFVDICRVPSDIFAVLLLTGCNLLRVAIAEFSTGSLTSISISFGWINISPLTIVRRWIFKSLLLFKDSGARVLAVRMCRKFSVTLSIHA